MTFERYCATLDEKAVEYDLLEHLPVRTIDEVRQHTPQLLNTMVKTVAFHVKDGDVVLVALRGADRVDYKRVAKTLGVSRRALRSLAPDAVSAELGVEPGGVAPIPLRSNQQLFVDQNVMALATIHVGSGRFDRTIALSPAALVNKLGGKLIEAAK